MGDVFLSAISLCWQFETEQASFQPWGNADKGCGRSSTACGRGSHTCARTLFVFCCASGAIKPSLKPCLNQKKQILIWQLFIQMLFIAINFSFTDLSLQMLLFHWQAETCHESAPLANLEQAGQLKDMLWSDSFCQENRKWSWRYARKLNHTSFVLQILASGDPTGCWNGRSAEGRMPCSSLSKSQYLVSCLPRCVKTALNQLQGKMRGFAL